MSDEDKIVIIGKKFMDSKKYMSPQVPTVWEQLVSYWYYIKGTKKRINEWVSPGLGMIAKDTGLSINTVKKCIRELYILGFIKKIEYRYNFETKRNESNIYYLDDNPENIIGKLPELDKFRKIKRAKNVIEDDGWGMPKNKS